MAAFQVAFHHCRWFRIYLLHGQVCLESTERNLDCTRLVIFSCVHMGKIKKIHLNISIHLKAAYQPVCLSSTMLQVNDNILYLYVCIYVCM